MLWHPLGKVRYLEIVLGHKVQWDGDAVVVLIVEVNLLNQNIDGTPQIEDHDQLAVILHLVEQGLF